MRRIEKPLHSSPGDVTGKQAMVEQPRKSLVWPLLCWSLLMAGGGVPAGVADDAHGGAAGPSAVLPTTADPGKAIAVTGDSFVCLKKMQAVRGFFVANLLDDLEATVAVATKPEGLRYPPGSVVQLIPTEAMVKHHEGWNAATNDWEFFELEVSEAGTRIKVRGTTEVVNKFGGNCFGCHQKAAPQWDLICEEGHGCDPLPIPDFLIHRAQRKDPRCK